VNKIFRFKDERFKEKWKEIEIKVQEKGINYVLSEELVGQIIDKYIARRAIGQVKEYHNSYDPGIKALSWVAREQVMFEQCELSVEKFDYLTYCSDIGRYAMSQLEDSNYHKPLGELYGLDLNALVDLRVAIHKAVIIFVNNQLLVEEVYLDYKGFLVQKFFGKEECVKEILTIVETYLSGEKNPQWRYDYNILARREAAGGRDLIVTYKLLLEDLLEAL
jgi:hypothetical protein